MKSAGCWQREMLLEVLIVGGNGCAFTVEEMFDTLASNLFDGCMGELTSANTSQNEDSTNQAKQVTGMAGDKSKGRQIKRNAGNKEATVRGHLEIARCFSAKEVWICAEKTVDVRYGM